jgi:hypothetical protein
VVNVFPTLQAAATEVNQKARAAAVGVGGESVLLFFIKAVTVTVAWATLSGHVCLVKSHVNSHTAWPQNMNTANLASASLGDGSLGCPQL